MTRPKRLTKTSIPQGLAGTPVTRALETFNPRERDRLVVANKAREAGETLSAPDARLWVRYENAVADAERTEILRRIPRKLFANLAGYANGQPLDFWDNRYGVPIGSTVVDLAAVLVWLRNDLAGRESNGADLDPASEDLFGGQSVALEKYREQRARLAELDVAERERSLLPRDEVRGVLSEIGTVLRHACDTLQHQFGPEARDVIAEALSEYDAIIEREFAK